MLSMKLNAILSRGKGRDFYDAMSFIEKTSPDYAFLSKRSGSSSRETLLDALSIRLSEIDLDKKSLDFESLIIDKVKAKMILDFKNH